MRASSASVRPTIEPAPRRAPARAAARTGTSRIAPTPATAATAGRMSDSTGTPTACAGAPRRRAPGATRAASPPAAGRGHEPEQRAARASRDRPDDGDRQRGPGRGAPAAPGIHRRAMVRDGQSRRRSAVLAATQASRSARDRVFTTDAGARPRPGAPGRRPSAGCRAPRSGGRRSRWRAGSRRATARRARSTARSSRCGEPFISRAVPVRAASAKIGVPVEVEVVAVADLCARPGGR